MKRISRFILIACLSACAATRAPVAFERPASADDPPPKPRVVVVLVDGLRADLAATMPEWQVLAREGSWTLKARTEKKPITVVSHAAIFTGVRSEKNGVAKHEPGKDEELDAWRPLKAKGTIFTAAHAAGLGTAAVIRKQKLRGLLPENAVDTLVFAKDDVDSAAAACKLLTEDDAARLIYVHLAEVDNVGHAKGWMSAAQKSAAMRVSNRLDEIRNCLGQAELAWHQPVYLLVTSDHGGHGRGHGDDVDTDRLVPWVVLGPDIARGKELPGPVRLIDTAAVVLTLLVQKESGLDIDGKVPEGLFAP